MGSTFMEQGRPYPRETSVPDIFFLALQKPDSLTEIMQRLGQSSHFTPPLASAPFLYQRASLLPEKLSAAPARIAMADSIAVFMKVRLDIIDYILTFLLRR